MPGDPQECRQRAIKCVNRAATYTSPAASQKFADLAIMWLMLAVQTAPAHLAIKDARLAADQLWPPSLCTCVTDPTCLLMAPNRHPSTLIRLRG